MLRVRAGLVAMLVVASSACATTPRRAPFEPAKPLPADAYGSYLRGRIAMYEGDYPRAIVHFRAGAAAAPDEAPMHVALIQALTRAGHRDEARRHAEQAQARWPRSPDVWLESGRVYRAAGVESHAVVSFEQAIELDPDLEDAYLGLASAWIALQEPDKAEVAYRRLLARLPDSETGNYRLAERLSERGQHLAAAGYLERILDLDPDHVRARVALARSQRAMGRADEAVATLREAFERSGGHPAVGERLFYQLLDVGDRDGALALLAYFDEDELDGETQVSFGYLYLHVGEATRARQLAQRLRRRQPSNADAVLLEANALERLRRRDQAIELLLAVPAERPAYADCRALAGELLARRGSTRRALEVLTEALALHPSHGGLINSQAFAHEQAGRVDEARRIFRAALAARPRDPQLLYDYGTFEDRVGRPDRAVRIIQRILDIDPDHTGALNFIGFSLADRNIELRRARRLLERAVELAPGNGFILDSYGWLLVREGRHREAEEVLWRASRLAPTEPEILWHLAELYLELADGTRALELLERARQHGPEGRMRERIEARIHALRTDK